jgi:hypothetical protein
MIDEEQIKKLRETIPDMLARNLSSVQPMPANTFLELYSISKSEKELNEEGYQPVSPDTKLMWTKK